MSVLLRGCWSGAVVATCGLASFAMAAQADPAVSDSGGAAPVVRVFSTSGRVDIGAALVARRGDTIPLVPVVQQFAGAGDAPTGAVSGAAIIDILGDGLGELSFASSAIVELPTGSGESLRLDLERFDVLAPDAVVIEVSASGERAVERPNVQLWRGRVEGDSGSRAFLGIGPDGVHGFVRSRGRTLSIATVPARLDSPLGGRTLVTDVSELRAASERLSSQDARHRRSLLAQMQRCAGGIVPPGADLPPVNTSASDTAARNDRGGGTCRVIRVAVDTDREFTQNLFANNASNASAYVTQLMGAVSTIYATDTGVQISVPFLRVWTTADPYSAGDTGAQLDQFQDYWIANRPAVAHDLAHLLSGRNLGGGIAYLGVLCNSSFHFGVSANLDGFFPMPVQDFNPNNWDPFVTAHELGHNFSSGHTHEIFSYNPIVDGCGNGDCAAIVTTGGTIMSYCHLCSGGLSNIDLTFGPRPSSVIRSYTYFSVPNCGLTLNPPSVSGISGPTGIACPGGTVQLTANVGASSVPLTYTWYRGTTRLLSTSPTITVFLNGPSANGQYRVEVSNGCQTASSPSVQITICRGDFNCSGGQPSTQDIFDFLAAWFSQNSRADVNLSGSISVQDVFDFLGSWFPGC